MQITLNVTDRTGHTAYAFDTEVKDEAATEAEKAFYAVLKSGGLVATVAADGTQEQVKTFDQLVASQAPQAITVPQFQGG